MVVLSKILVILDQVEHSDEETRSNSTYWCGVLVQYGRESSIGYYPQILMKLAPLFSDTKSIQNIIDNACGAVARMIFASPQSVPLDQVLPVFLKALPLKKRFC